MTEEQNLAYINSQTACAMIEAMGMQAQNEWRKCCNMEPEYKYQDFIDVYVRYGIDHNSVIGSFRR